MLFETRPSDFGAPAGSLPLPERLRVRVTSPLEDELTLLRLTAGDDRRAVFRWRLSDRQLAWSGNVTRIWPDLTGKRFSTESGWTSLLHPDDRHTFTQLKAGLLLHPRRFAFEGRLAFGNGTTSPVCMTGEARREEDGSVHAIGILAPAQSQQTDEIPACKLPVCEQAPSSRFGYPEDFMLALNHTIAAASAGNASGALILLHLNNLPMIVNSCGQRTTERLVESLIPAIVDIAADAMVARLSREQVGIILPLADAAQMRHAAEEAQQRIERCGHSETEGLVHITCTAAGIDFPGTAKNASEALDKAYMILGTPGPQRYRTFEDVRSELIQSRQNMGLANYLRRAIEEDRLRLAFQPIIESRSGDVAHYEALLRVLGDDGKISSAGPLIPIAEAMGMIDTVDRLVLQLVIEELRKSPGITIAFNVSNLTTDNTQWLDAFHDAVKSCPDVANRIIVEITETAAQRDLRRTAFFVASLQSTGAMVALDDFGSGYTSFRQLKALSVDIVKIDGAFVKDLGHNIENRFFIKTLLGFTSGMGLKTVAEFVESGEIAKILMELGVEYMQGYYFGKPEVATPWR